MWCLQNLMLHKINPGANQREHLVNFMIRAALSIDDVDLQMDAIVALQKWIEMIDDQIIRDLFNAQLIERLLTIMTTCFSRIDALQLFMINIILRCLGEMASTCNIQEALQALFNLNGLEKLNMVLQSND